jgi:hypothetical protein
MVFMPPLKYHSQSSSLEHPAQLMDHRWRTDEGNQPSRYVEVPNHGRLLRQLALSGQIRLSDRWQVLFRAHAQKCFSLGRREKAVGEDLSSLLP